MNEDTKITKAEQELFSKHISTQPTIIPEGVQTSPAPTSTHSDMVKNASEIAKVLTKVINDTKMFVVINGRKHVYVEGWEVLGAMLRCTSEIVLIKEYKNGYWAEAVIKDASGIQLSRSVGICLRTEKNWATKDEYAILSMAQTRALGKAYRLALSWIMLMAGYDPCPAEEIPHTKK